MTAVKLNLKAGLTSILDKIQKEIILKFRNFYQRRIFELDLAPSKGFTYPFQITGDGGQNHKRSVGKIKTLIMKSLTRDIPSISLSQVEFMDTSSGNAIEVYLKDFEYVASDIENLPADLRTRVEGLSNIGLGSIIEKALFSNTKRLSGLRRYCRYLNYLARKYSVPVKVEVVKKAKQSNSAQSLASEGVFELGLKLTFGSWSITAADYFGRYCEQKRNGAVSDELFSNSEIWDARHYLNAHGESVDSEFEQYHIAVFFIHLDKILQSLKTITRKIEYGYSAFTLRV